VDGVLNAGTPRADVLGDRSAAPTETKRGGKAMEKQLHQKPGKVIEKSRKKKYNPRVGKRDAARRRVKMWGLYAKNAN
jgi:hypothetical protein